MRTHGVLRSSSNFDGRFREIVRQQRNFNVNAGNQEIRSDRSDHRT